MDADDFELEFDSGRLSARAGRSATTAGTRISRRWPTSGRGRRSRSGRVRAATARSIPGSTPADFAQIDTDVIHTLTGPFFIEGAEPGDLLRIEVIDIQPDGNGVTLIWPGSGFGMLPYDEFEPTLVHWEIARGGARSAQLPGVTIRGAAHPGQSRG